MARKLRVTVVADCPLVVEDGRSDEDIIQEEKGSIDKIGLAEYMDVLIDWEKTHLKTKVEVISDEEGS